MYGVANRPNGTAHKSFADAPYKIAAKSGTAQVFGLKENETYNAHKIAERLRDHKLMTAFAPYDKPGIGQGYWTATPVQMNKAMMILINDGVIKVPHLLRATREGSAMVPYRQPPDAPIGDIHSGYWEIAKEESADTFFYQVAYDMGIDRLSEWMTKFGYGHRTGIDLPQESAGNMPTRDWKMKRFKKPWYQGDTIPVRALQAAYPPASTVKPYVAVSALSAGVINRNTSLFDPGWWQLPGSEKRYRDWKKWGHGRLNVTKSL
ncbi:hypothetical protein CRX72_11260, partial [Pantoea sp. BRM17]